MHLCGLVSSELIALVTSFYSVNQTSCEISLIKELAIILERSNTSYSPVKQGPNLARNGVFLLYLFCIAYGSQFLGKKVLGIFSGRTFFIGGFFSLNKRKKWTKKYNPVEQQKFDRYQKFYLPFSKIVRNCNRNPNFSFKRSFYRKLQRKERTKENQLTANRKQWKMQKKRYIKNTPFIARFWPYLTGLIGYHTTNNALK